MFNKKITLSLLPLIATLSLHATNPFGDDIFKEMMQMQRDMDQMFERMQKRTSGLVNPFATYKMDFIDKGDYYELLTGIPESKENHIDINTANGLMSITAKIVQEQKNKTGNLLSQSHSVRMYQQSISLPKDADESTIKTEYKNGKLVVSIAKDPSTSSGTEEKKTQEKNETKDP